MVNLAVTRQDAESFLCKEGSLTEYNKKMATTWGDIFGSSQMEMKDFVEEHKPSQLNTVWITQVIFLAFMLLQLIYLTAEAQHHLLLNDPPTKLSSLHQHCSQTRPLPFLSLSCLLCNPGTPHPNLESHVYIPILPGLLGWDSLPPFKRSFTWFFPPKSIFLALHTYLALFSVLLLGYTFSLTLETYLDPALPEKLHRVYYISELIALPSKAPVSPLPHRHSLYP